MHYVKVIGEKYVPFDLETNRTYHFSNAAHLTLFDDDLLTVDGYQSESRSHKE